MKKLFTLAAAVLASFSLWAQTTLATFEVTLTEAPTAAYASYSDDDADYTCNKVGSNSSSNYCLVGSHYYMKLTAADAYVKIKLKSGSIVAGDIVYVYHNHTSAKNGVGFAMTSGGTNGSTGNATANTELELSYTLTASDIANDGSISVYRQGSNLYVGKIKVVRPAPTCTSPATELSIDPVESAPYYAGNTIHFSLNGGNGSAKTLTLDGQPYEYLQWLMEEGEHTFAVSQEVSEGICGGSAELTINVLSNTPVMAVTVDGPASGFIGAELVYTATAANATQFAWFVDGVDVNTNTASFTYTGIKGEHSIVCKARNEFNATDEWIASDAKVITITKVCGELIKATTNGAVTGVIGGTISTNLSSGSSKKLDKSKYFGVQLANGTFMAGDIFTIHVTAAAGLGKCMLYADNAGENLIIDAGSDGYYTTGELTVTLPDAATGKNAIYLYREDGNTQWNPTFDWISVSRSCEISNDATIHSLTVNGDEVTLTEGTKKYEYSVSSSYSDPSVEVAFAIHPLATASIASPFTIPTPTTGNTGGQAITVTAEDGTEETYTVFVTKSASLSGDWTLKALSVEGYTLTPAFHPDTLEYHITKAYGAENPAESKVTATANHANATVVVNAYATNFTITITAENGVSNAYIIWIDEAEAPRALNEIIMSNSYQAYILAGDPFNIYAYYLAGEDIPTVKSTIVSEGATAVQNGNILRVTGEDDNFDEYTLNIAAVEPIDFTTNEIVFDGLETWVKSGYGWDASKGWKFSKTDNDYSREIAGKTHVEIFLPACDTVIIKDKSRSDRDVHVYVNGTEVGSKTKLLQAGVPYAVEQDAPFMLSVISDQTDGDGGLGAIRMAKKTIPTAIENTNETINVVKVLRNGQLLIIRDGKTYNVTGIEVR